MVFHRPGPIRYVASRTLHQREHFQMVLALQEVPSGLSFLAKTMWSDDRFDEVQREMEILKRVAHHPNIVRCFPEPIENPSSMGYLMQDAQVQLHDILSEGVVFEEELKWLCLRQMNDALDFLRKTGLAHCQISPHTIMLPHDNWRVAQLSEFGSAKPLARGNFRSKGKDVSSDDAKYRASECVIYMNQEACFRNDSYS